MASLLAFGAGAAVLAAALPSAVSAVGLLKDGDTFSERSSFASFTPASVDPGLAQLVAERSGGKARMMRFTPAGANSWGESRSVTVAVRVDSQAANAIGGRASGEASRDGALEEVGLRLAPTRYNLGLARGYRSFAQAPALSASLSSADIPDLAEFRPAASARKDADRFAPRIGLEQELATGRSEQEASRLADQMLDVGGSYRLTRNLDVTAGVRYQQDRDLRPLPDLEKQDSQAVYIGTQFRF